MTIVAAHATIADLEEDGLYTGPVGLEIKG
jgi:hypothetical protein